MNRKLAIKKSDGSPPGPKSKTIIDSSSLKDSKPTEEELRNDVDEDEDEDMWEHDPEPTEEELRKAEEERLNDEAEYMWLRHQQI